MQISISRWTGRDMVREKRRTAVTRLPSERGRTVFVTDTGIPSPAPAPVPADGHQAWPAGTVVPKHRGRPSPVGSRCDAIGADHGHVQST